MGMTGMTMLAMTAMGHAVFLSVALPVTAGILFWVWRSERTRRGKIADARNARIAKWGVHLDGVDKAAFVAACFNAAWPKKGREFLKYDPEHPVMTSEGAYAVVRQGLKTKKKIIVELDGRVLEIDFSGGDIVDSEKFDRRYGNGHVVMLRIANDLRQNPDDVNSEFIQKIHREGITQAARDLKERIEESARIDRDEEGRPVAPRCLGFAIESIQILKKINSILAEVG